MTLTLQCPPEGVGALLCRFPDGQAPLGSQLLVGANECVVMCAHGGVLGVVPPGTHALHPQSLPFLATTVVGGTTVQVELWFVQTVPCHGLKLGGPLGKVRDSATGVACTVRGVGEYSLSVSDPARLVNACTVAAYHDAAPLLAWVGQLIMRRVGGALSTLVEGEGMSVTAYDLGMRLGERVSGDLGELAASGLSFVRMGELTLGFSEEDSTALRLAQAGNARAKRALAVKAASSLRCTRCSKVHEGGNFCVACGAPLRAGPRA